MIKVDIDRSPNELVDIDIRLRGAVWVSRNKPNQLKETGGMEKPYQGKRPEETRSSIS